MLDKHLLLTYAGLQLIIKTFLLIRYRNTECDKPIYMWLKMYMVSSLIHASMETYLHFYRNIRRHNYYVQKCDTFTRNINLFILYPFAIWLLNSNCYEQMPYLYYLLTYVFILGTLYLIFGLLYIVYFIGNPRNIFRKITRFVLWMIYAYFWSILTTFLLIHYFSKEGLDDKYYIWLIMYTISVYMLSIIETYRKIYFNDIFVMANALGYKKPIQIIQLYILNIFGCHCLITTKTEMTGIYYLLFGYIIYYSVIIIISPIGERNMRLDRERGRLLAMDVRHPTTGATDNEINQLHTVIYDHNTTDILEEDAICRICMEDYVDEINLKIMPCNTKHHFHQTCIGQWLVINKICPICKAII